MALRQTRSWWTWIALAGALALATAVIALATAPTPAAASEHAVAVSAVDNAFSPVSVEISAGGTVTWTNNGAVPHTVTGENFVYDVVLNPGESASHTFTEAGTYSYFCQFHPPGMVGTVVVVADPAEPAPPAPAPPAVGSGTTFGQQTQTTAAALAGLAVLFGAAAVWLRLRPELSRR